MKSKRPDPTPQRPHSNPEASFNSVVLPNVFTERSHLPNTPTCDAPSWYPRMLCCGPPSVEYFLKLELGTMLFSFYYMEVSLFLIILLFMRIFLGYSSSVFGSKSVEELVLAVSHALRKFVFTSLLFANTRSILVDVVSTS